MKSQLQLLTRAIHQNCSFSLDSQSYQFLKIWHYHPQIELVFILESAGTRYVGDHIETFGSGEIVLIGENLPHLWLNDKEYFDETAHLKAKALVVHFMESFRDNFLKLPEMDSINKLFEKAKRGIKFKGEANQPILEKAKELEGFEELDRIIRIIEILKDLTKHNDYQILSSASYTGGIDSTKGDHKMERINNYILNNFKNGVSLEEVAELANMNTSAFSRYFKQVQKKTFTKFVNEIKIGHACKLLIEEDYNIAEVCYNSGYKNLSNFNRKFKEIKKTSPSEFMKQHAKI